MLSPEIERELSEAFEGQFMRPYIVAGDYFEVDTPSGIEIVPAEVVSLPFRVNFRQGGTFIEEYSTLETWRHIQRAFLPYVGASSIDGVSPRTGYIARLSAPGYMGCIEWAAFETADDAARYLIDTYGAE